MIENIKKLHGVLSKVLGIDECSITDEMSPHSVPSWDSFNSLMLASELEADFNVCFTMGEVVALKNVADIKSALRRHGVELP